jgi:hypothetical protein
MRKSIDQRLRELTTLERLLDEARTARARLEKSLAERDLELAALRPFRTRSETLAKREKDLEKLLAERQAALTDAGRTLAKVEREKGVLRAAAEARFAGISLTGRRVLFLVDTSGSMDLLDEKTPAPGKWREVRETVARLMRSLPGLEAYQLITFAAKTDFPLGRAGKWLTYEPDSSPERVVKVLGEIKPSGGTNMYTALEAAFKMRAEGLDTVYLLSDGLPNQGEGITAEQGRELSEIDRGVLLGKYIRSKLQANWNRAEPKQPRVRINTIGFFYESPDLGAFLWALARENDGSFVGMSKP